MNQAPLRIYHLFPRHMNLYGDLGNIIALSMRLRWRGLAFEVIGVNPGDRPDFGRADLLFVGGGQDRGQKLVAPYLEEMGPDIRREVDDGLPALTICGGESKILFRENRRGKLQNGQENTTITF